MDGHLETEERGNFGWALERMAAGEYVRRKGWNGKGLRVGMQSPDDHSKMRLPFLYLMHEQAVLCPYNAPQTDLLADDWVWAATPAMPHTHDLATGQAFRGVLEGLLQGRRYRRLGWNGAGQFVFLVPGSVFLVNREPLLSILGSGTEVRYRSHIDIRLVDGSISVWTASQTDLLSADWVEVLKEADA